MAIDPELVRALEELCGLELPPRERGPAAVHLERMLAQAASLAAVDPGPGAPAGRPAAAPATCPLRADAPRPSLPRPAALGGAPDQDGAFFRVPPLLPARAEAEAEREREPEEASDGD